MWLQDKSYPEQAIALRETNLIPLTLTEHHIPAWNLSKSSESDQSD